MTKIMVVDDEKPTLSMFRLFLEAYGFEVLTAENGEEGLALFEAENPPIVLTDIKMPGMDGIEVLKRIKEMNPHAEVIVITGHGDMDLAIKALNLDATDFINKPIQQADLDSALKRAEERIRFASGQNAEIALEMRGEAGVIHVRSNLTSKTEPHLMDAYRKVVDEGKSLVLAFSDNASVNGAGIAVLSQLLLESRRQGVKTAVAGLSDNFRKVFDIVGIFKLTEVHATVDEALAAVAKE